MKTLDVCLHISCPRTLEEGIVEQLLEHREWVPGFSTAHIDGFGKSGIARHPSEQVRGRAGRTYIFCLLNSADAERMIAHLSTVLPTPEVFYWVTPVLASGRLA